MPKFAVSLIGMRRPEGTRTALETMLRHAPSDTLFFLTSNGCPATADVFCKIAARVGERVKVTENANNEGFQAPHHRQFVAASNAGCEFCLIANDDIDVPARFLEQLAEPMERDPLIAITGPADTCAYLNHEFHGQSGSGAPHYIEGSLSLFRIEIMRQLRRSLWCPELTFCYSEDSSVSLFVQEKGFKIATVPMKAPHLRSVTVNAHPDVKRLCMESQAHNHAVNLKRWKYWMDTRRFDVPIVIRREYAIGDVILIEPIIRTIRKSRPLSPILVETRFPELFANHPEVQQSATKIAAPHNALIVDLNGAYENRPMRHYCQAYWEAAAEVIAGLEPLELRACLYPSPNEIEWARNAIAKLRGPIVLIATDDTTWTSRNWPQDRMREVAKWLVSQGCSVIAVGSKDRAFAASLPKVTNLVGQTSLMQLAALCSVSQMMVTVDTGSLHLAQAVGCPVVSLFGISYACYVTTQGSRCATAECPSHLHTAGIRHRVVGKTFLDVGTECMDAILVEDVIQGIKKLEVV